MKFVNYRLGLIAGHCGQEAPGSLGITEQELVEFGDVRVVRNPVRQKAPVGVGAAGRDPLPDVFARPARTGTRPFQITAETPLAAARFRRWPNSPKPVTSVSAWAPAWANTTDASRLSCPMTAIASAIARCSSLPCLAAVVMIPSPSGLVRIKNVAHAGARVGDDCSGVHSPHHGQAEDRLLGLDRMPADDGDSRLIRLVDGASKDLPQHLGR